MGIEKCSSWDLDNNTWGGWGEVIGTVLVDAVEPPFKEESITDEEMMLYFAQEHDCSFHPKEFDDDDAEFVDFIFSMYGTTSLDEEEEPAASVVDDNFSTFQQVYN
nr:hypothetical protein [Tanacetum cinerariifolium]